jgi:hypothetical protein
MAKLIVRRGMRPEYYEFLSVTAGANRDELIVDRRRTTNQRPQDSAGQQEPVERRGPAAEKWIDEDVIVVKS